MDLSDEQLDWLAEHFIYPGKAWIKPPPLEQSLLDLDLIKAETFPYDDGFDVIVLSLNHRGWAIAVQRRSEVVKTHYSKFDEAFIKTAEMAEVPLEQLSEFLSSDDKVTRDIASIKLDRLLKDKKDG